MKFQLCRTLAPMLLLATLVNLKRKRRTAMTKHAAFGPELTALMVVV
jgi:hypothetical protein